jgi:hypothetical protein
MASFYEKLSFVMGGEDQVDPQFRQTFSEFNEFTKGAADFSMFGMNFGTPASAPAPATITTGPASADGLYGPSASFNPQPSAFGGINPYAYAGDKKKGASRLSADLIRAQYADYESRFAPVENFAVQALRPNGTMDGQFDVARSRQSVLNAGANLQGQQERAMGRFGLGVTAPNIASSNEVTGGVVAGTNQARMADADRRLQMLGGGGRTGG